MADPGAIMTERKADPEMVKALVARLQERLIPKLQDPRIRRRTVVAVKVMSIVDRRIAKGEPSRPGEWDDVRAVVQDKPHILPLIDAVEGAVEKFAAELDEKLQGGEGDPAARRAAAGLIRLTIMTKLKEIREHESDDAAAHPAEDEKD